MTDDEQIKQGPCAVNKCEDEQQAHRCAKAWSADREFRGLWTIIHAPSSEGLRYFVVQGDGGLITNQERLIARYKNGKLYRDE